MPTLLETQKAFLGTVFGSGEIGYDGAAIAKTILKDGIAVTDRLQIYRNNTVILLTEALAATFPVVHKLVGCDFFDLLASTFVRTHPPKNPSLISYGGTFADFIDGFEPAQNLPYLGDVARLEWAWNEAYHAADASPLDPRALGATPEERLGDIVFVLHPSARFVHSPYPIRAIWDANQDGSNQDAAISLDDGGERALVIRPGVDVEVRSLSAGAFAFLNRIADGLTIAHALQSPLDTNPGFNLEVLLGTAIADGLFTDAFLEGTSLSSRT